MALSSADGHAGDAASLLVEHDADEPAVEDADRGERRDAEREDDPEVAPGHREDRAEQELEEPDVEPVGGRDEHDAECDAGVEDERERLVAGRCPRACGASSIASAPATAKQRAVSTGETSSR